MNQAEAKHTFALTAPIERAKLKRMYRELVKRYHPDAGGDAEMFRMVDEAYRFLLANPDGIFVDTVRAETEEGTSLSELGQGLGLTANARDCKMCNGRGYVEARGILWHPHAPCRRCKLLGSTFGCLICEGPGNFFSKSRFTKTVVSVFRVCVFCLGKGEVAIFNPVLPKGYLVDGRLGQKARKRQALPRKTNN